MSIWEIPAPGHTCPTCGHDMSAHTGSCILVETLYDALGEDNCAAEATVEGKTMRVQQWTNPFTQEPMWVWGAPAQWDRCKYAFNSAEVEESVFDQGFDPAALIWQRVDGR